jgi:hypothetical protein
VPATIRSRVWRVTGMIFLRGVLVAPTYCDGTANNGMTYPVFIDAYAVNSEDAAARYATRELREAAR